MVSFATLSTARCSVCRHEDNQKIPSVVVITKIASCSVSILTQKIVLCHNASAAPGYLRACVSVCVCVFARARVCLCMDGWVGAGLPERARVCVYVCL